MKIKYSLALPVFAVFFVWSSTVFAASGDVLNIMFGDTFRYPYSGAAMVGVSGQYWNSSEDASLKLSNGNNANWDFSYTCDAYTDIRNASDRGFAGTINDNLMRSFISTDVLDTLNFSGLDAGYSYELTVYSQTEKDLYGKGPQNTIFTYKGNASQITGDSRNSTFVQNQNYLQLSVIADKSGNLVISYSPGAGTTSALVNGLQLKQLSSAPVSEPPPFSPVPEPTSMILTGIGGVMYLYRRKRSFQNKE
jgi:hypothetical protein